MWLESKNSVEVNYFIFARFSWLLHADSVLQTLNSIDLFLSDRRKLEEPFKAFSRNRVPYHIFFLFVHIPFNTIDLFLIRNLRSCKNSLELPG